jgi:hypothetical protein
MELIMPYVGDDYLTVKEYKGLRQKWREALTSTPWKAWATWYLSPAGKRDRAAVERARQDEARNQKAVAAEITAQRRAMAEESRQAGLDPVRNDEVSRLRVVANERDPETGGNYSERALAAQRQLAAMSVQPRAGRVG